MRARSLTSPVLRSVLRLGLIHSEPRSWVPGTKAQLLATLPPCCVNEGLGAPRGARGWLGKRAPQEAGAAATWSLPCVSLPLCPSLKASSCDQSSKCHLPALPSPRPRRARPSIPTGLLASKGVGLGLERARGPGRRAAFGRAPGSRVPGSKPMASPRKACAPQAWPRRDSWVAGTASCSMRGLHTGPGGDTRRLARPVSPRAALAARTPGNGLPPSLRLPVPTQNALTKLPRARAAPPHVPAPHSVTLGLGSQHPHPAGHRLSRIPSYSSYTATSGLTPAPHKARPRDPASAPHSRSAPAPARTPAR